LQQRIIGNAVRLIAVLAQYQHSVTKVSYFGYECFAMWALPKKIVMIPVFWKIWVENMMTVFKDRFK